jgi:aryl-alcohol dehydrogenase-like predicted oxidoreductase
VETIDLYQLHRIDPLVPFEDQIGALKRLRDEGKVRHVGLSEVSVAELVRADRIVPVVSVQNLYNLTDRRSEDVLEHCERAGIAFLPWLPVQPSTAARGGEPVARIAARLGVTPTQVALAWLLHRSPAMLPIPGTSSIAHLEENVAAAGLELSTEDLRTLGTRMPSAV